MVFNKKVKDLIAAKKPKNVRMHDYWTMMIVEAFKGNIVYDSNSRLLYRQHQNNSVGFGKGHITYIKRLLKSALLNRNERQKQAIEFYHLYNDVLPKESSTTLLKVINYRNGIVNRVRLAFDKEFLTPSFKINLLFKISVILGLF
jgi:rhamnosyltransferase